ncbi:hypothetical protein PG991_000074 [Apiospora marii]|uniref:Nephrocystin 3-like N-terminal domain-containing protein n=1 Tax=Apiospora marii TaxID=335849 RepID=A0ABR1T121_9PEZI
MTMKRQNDGYQGNGNGMKRRRPSGNEDYTVGWICAISTEYVAARAFLDGEHEDPEHIAQHDNNSYTLGRMGRHNVVIAVLPDGEYGLASAATVARDMLHSFPNVRIGLMVGIGGGAPSAKNDIRLGDVVVSAPKDGRGGVFQYDYGKTIQDQTFRETGFSAPPPPVLRTAVSGIKARYESDGHQIQEAIAAVLGTKPRLRKKYRQPNVSTDRVYRTDVKHPVFNGASCMTACSADASQLVLRRARDQDDDNPTVHYGLIASANQLMKDAVVRDKLAHEEDVLCFEMEAAGLMNHFPCLVIRGICDYADTHKNKEWQGYAAMTAAAYANDVLHQIAPNKVEAEKRLSENLADIRLASTRNSGLAIPPDPSINFNIAREQHQQGTGKWLLESDQYRKWKTERNSFLWLKGISGCGKTILSSSVITDLEQGATFPNLVYFYFDFNDTDKQSVEKAVRSLIAQLYYKRPDLRSEVDAQYLWHGNGGRQPGSASLFTLFQNMVRHAGESWIVLDALDECQAQDNRLFTWIQTFRNANLNIHFLATSQPKQDLQTRIEKWAGVEIIVLDSDRIWGDINSYIKARTKQMVRWQYLPEVRKEIEDKLVPRFRWVSCQIRTLEDCLDRRSVQRELTTLPRDLEATYKRILQRIPTKHLDNTKRLLQFLTDSVRPLRLEEAVDVIAVSPSSHPQFRPVDRMPMPEEVLRYCSSLAVLVKRENKEYGITITEIQLAHSSVQRYLMSDQLEPEMASDLEMVNAKAAIVNVCLSYLLSLDHTHSLQGVMEKYPLAQYCAQYWATHAAAVELSRQGVAPIVKEYLSNEDAFALGYRLYSPDRAWKGVFDEIEEPVSTLYYASLSGLCRSVHMLICAGANVNAQGGYYRNALQAASSRGHEDNVALLLSNGAEVNAQGGVYGNALRAASSKGHEHIVQLLLQNGADKDQREGLAGTALYAASSRGHARIVRLLLDNNADLNIKGGYFGNALQAASSQGHKEVTVMLPKYNAQGGLHSEAFHMASDSGLSAAMELLKKNSDKFILQGTLRDNEDQAVYSSSSNYESIVQQLLEKDVDVNTQGGYYGTALQAASARGDPNIVKLLLNKGANIDARGGVYHTALYAASSNGCDEVVQLLLNRSADAKITTILEKTPLHAASEKGHEKVVKLLLQRGVDVKATDSDGRTPLHMASDEGHEKLVKLLLENNADANAGDRRMQTPLHIVALKGKPEVAKLLLENGAYANAIDLRMQTPLHIVAKLLLEKGAYAKAIDLYGQNPLYCASRRNLGGFGTALHKRYEGVAKLLIEKGADIIEITETVRGVSPSNDVFV